MGERLWDKLKTRKQSREGKKGNKGAWKGWKEMEESDENSGRDRRGEDREHFWEVADLEGGGGGMQREGHLSPPALLALAVYVIPAPASCFSALAKMRGGCPQLNLWTILIPALAFKACVTCGCLGRCWMLFIHLDCLVGREEGVKVMNSHTSGHKKAFTGAGGDHPLPPIAVAEVYMGSTVFQ